MRKALYLAGTFLISPAYADHTSFVLANNSTHPVLSVFATSTQNRSLGNDLLGDKILAPGDTTVVKPRDNRGCMYDVVITFACSEPVNRRNLNLCTISRLSTRGQGVGVPRRSERPSSYQDWH